MKGNVLIVDDDQSMCEMLEADLKSRGFNILWSKSAEDALLMVSKNDFDVILTDLRMPKMDGIAFCSLVMSFRPDIPIIVMTAFGSMETAIEAIRAGAYDFITKPMELDILSIILKRAVHHRSLYEQINSLKKEIAQSKRFNEIIGDSPPMKVLFNRLKRINDTDITVLITGESGTGKELVARALHRQSSRREGPFVSVNCAAIPETLLESELFGHEKGAFTDARSVHKGLFLQAEGGTLFLDEIGDFPIFLQPKLLRALEEHSVRPVGAEREIRFNVRIIAATNQNLEKAVKENNFREDLLFRINVMNVKVPPLRHRGTDILVLSKHFVEKFAKQYGKEVAGISEAVAKRLLSYYWKGNVRELRNVIERAIALTTHEKIVLEDIPERLRSHPKKPSIVGKDNPVELLSLAELEHRYILHVLKAVDGNKTKAAKILDVDRKTLYRKMIRNGIHEEHRDNYPDDPTFPGFFKF